MTTAHAANVVRYRLAPEQSTFTVQAYAEGLFSAFGHDPVIAIRDFSGEAEFVPDTFEVANLKLTVKANSLAVANDVKEKDRVEIERMMRDEVLETAKYPEIVFVSTSVSPSPMGRGRYRARVIGDLTLHGVTQKNVWISAEVTLTEDSLLAKGEFTLKQTDFGIKLVSVAGGTLKVKNELKFSFNLVAKKE
ncbi:MAG: YceI family protein [Acidobacteriota bacterium]